MEVNLATLCVIFYLCYNFQVYSCRHDRCSHRNCKFLPDDDKCGPVSHSPRVVGGKDAALGEFPWMAILFATDETDRRHPALSCGGSIITSRHVLTAAHCVPARPLIISHVRVGEHDLNSTTDCTVDGVCAPEAKDVAVSRTVTHEGFDNKYHNDIALLHLESSIDFNLYVAPICLPMAKWFKSEKYQENSKLRAAGWGIKDVVLDEMAIVLQTVTLPYVPLDECQEDYTERDITEKQLCAGGVEGEDSCEGDSGGPLMGIYSVKKGPERYFQVGVTSFGPSLCGIESPAVYTNVNQYISWILDSLE